MFFLGRAIKRSKQPQLPMICRGIAYFKQEKFLHALKEFTAVIKLLKKLGNLPENVQDCFIARYNRGLTHFRVGNDHDGIHDLIAALQLMDNDTEKSSSALQARNVLACALRRLGRFSEAIEQTMICRKIISEEEEKRKRKETRNNMNETAPPSSEDDGVINHVITNINHKNIVEMKQKYANEEGSVHSAISENSSEGSVTKSNRRSISKSHDDSASIKVQKVQITVDIKSTTSISMRDRKKEMLLQHTAVKEVVGAQSGQLDAFKIMNGFKRNIFETIFLRPTLIQESFASLPLTRTNEQLQIIGSVLRGFPLLSSLSPDAIKELSISAEYRPLPTKRNILSQNRAVDAVCMILTGQVQMRLDTDSNNTASHTVTIGDLQAGEIFGHIDILFREQNPFVQQFLRDEEVEDIAVAWNIVPPEGPTSQSASQSVFSDMDDRRSPPKHQSQQQQALPRALRSGSFMSYHVQAPTELIMIRRKDFNRHISPNAIKCLEDRLVAIRSTGIFAGYPSTEIVRIARMGFVRHYKSEDIILAQDSVPDKLYIVMKGLCRVIKHPTRAETVVRKLAELQEQAREFDCKYAFHHLLRGVATLVPETSVPPDRRSNHVTQSELERYKLDLEINRLQAQLSKAKTQDSKEQQQQQQQQQQPNPISDGSTVSSNISIGKNFCEVATIKRPQLFGESCLLEPTNGVSLGTIIADTGCEIFELHKSHIQTIHISESVLDKVRQRSVVYPTDSTLETDIEFQKDWSAYKNALMSSVCQNSAKKLKENQPVEAMEFSGNAMKL